MVWGVSFEVPENSIVAILGSNGAGKTTTLLGVMGLLPVKAGMVTYRGVSIVGAPTHTLVERGVVMIPEERATFASLTVADNLQVGAYNRRARNRSDQTMEEVFATFPALAKRKAQFAGTLSGGERRMLAIGKALMARPELLILDEPSLGLAPLVVESTFAAIEAIRKQGVAVLMVEQHLEATLELADYAYILELGHIVAAGTSAELHDQPRVREAYLGL